MPNLLDLPREVRDHIYTYSTHDLRLKWIQEAGGWASKLSPVVNVQVNDAPIVSVLLTHSRLKEEYMQSTIYRQLSMTLRLESAARASTTAHSRSLAGSGTSLTTATVSMLRRVIHITIFVDCGSICTGSVYPNNVLCSDLEQLLNILASPATRLASIKIAMQYDDGLSLPDTMLDFAYLPGNFFPGVPHALVGLPLVQRAGAYRLTRGETPSHIGAASPRVSHSIDDTACYVYGKERYWSEEEVLEEWPNAETEAPEVGKGRKARLPNVIKGWREKRGHEEAKAWFGAERLMHGQVI
jgi:hypothetical protein